MKIRKYKPSDKKQIMEMVAEILGNIFNGDPNQFKVLKEFHITKDYVLYLVAETQGPDGKIIGTMALKKINNKTVRLKRMYIRIGYGRRGLAQKLLTKIIDFAKQKGYKKLLLHTYPTMKNAQRFYKKNKFVESTGDDPEQIHVVRYLD